MDCSLPGSSVHGIFQARVLEWGAIAFSVRQDTLLLYNAKECRGGKKVCPFFLLENSRPLCPGPLDFLSTCLGNDSLTTALLKFWELDLYPPRQEIREFLSWEISPRNKTEADISVSLNEKLSSLSFYPILKFTPTPTYLTNMNSETNHQISKENF